MLFVIMSGIASALLFLIKKRLQKMMHIGKEKIWDNLRMEIISCFSEIINNAFIFNNRFKLFFFFTKARLVKFEIKRKHERSDFS